MIGKSFWSAVAISAAVAASHPPARAGEPRFYRDDPLAQVADSQDARGVAARDIDLVYDMLENSFASRGDATPNVRAQNINTIDEVPDSSWFTNRLGSRSLTAAELVPGPNATNGPAPGTWTVIAAKSDGVTPGFTVRDALGEVWFIKFDPPGYPAMATGTEVVVTKLFWALGYHVAEVHLAMLRPSNLAIDERAHISVPNGGTRRLKSADLVTVLRGAHRDADGTYRVIASKRLEGRPVGGFRFYGVRSDDPNDIIPHEHRRELRAYGTFAAWLNHVDSKSINTLDTVVDHGGRAIVRHHLLDFGSTIGSAGVYPREPYEGWEYLLEPRKTLAGVPSLGLYVKDWRTVPIYRAASVGAFPIGHSAWDPEAWKPRYPNAAFRAARLDDKFWAARRLHAVTDDMLHAVIRAGRFNDTRSEEMLSRFLTERRDAIVRRYLRALNPVVDARLDASTLSFRNAAVDAGVAAAPAEYVVRWHRFDNVTDATHPLAETRHRETSAEAPATLPASVGAYIRADISASGGPASWAQPVHAYFVREMEGWRLVGFARVPAGRSPGAPTAMRARSR
jgi:hypothetical protein